jgi:sRNA-binding regulator protein Hfq
MDKETQYPKTWGLRTAAFFARCEGEKIDVHLMNGGQIQIIEGELLGVDTYDIFLKALGGTVMVPKHGVLFILLRDQE